MHQSLDVRRVTFHEHAADAQGRSTSEKVRVRTADCTDFEVTRSERHLLHFFVGGRPHTSPRPSARIDSRCHTEPFGRRLHSEPEDAVIANHQNANSMPVAAEDDGSRVRTHSHVSNASTHVSSCASSTTADVDEHSGAAVAHNCSHTSSGNGQSGDQDDAHTCEVGYTANMRQDSIFLGAKQNGLGPEMWGIHMNQLQAICNDTRYIKPLKDIYGRHTKGGMNMREVVDKVVKPVTHKSGMGYALLSNQPKGLSARIFVSHCWDEGFEDFLSAVSSTHIRGPYWICSTAIYQNEDIPALTISRQLGDGPPSSSPFAIVLRQAELMVCVATRSVNLYTRMWCVYEMFVATQLQVKVVMAQAMSYSEDCGFLDTFTKQCEEHINSRAAKCGVKEDELKIRDAIQCIDGGYDHVDVAVEVERLNALISRHCDAAVQYARRQSVEEDGIAALARTNSGHHRADLQKTYVRYIARQLRRIASKGQVAKPYTHVVASVLLAKESALRQAAARALGDLGDVAAEHANALRHCAVEDEDLEVRATAADALGRLGGDAASEQVRELADIVVGGSEPARRCRAAKALSFVGDAAEDCMTVLSSALDDESPVVRSSISGVLASIATSRTLKRGLTRDSWPEKFDWQVEKEKIKDNFREADRNNDGTLDLNELHTLLRHGKSDIEASEVRNLFKIVDSNGDGRITFDEFVDFVFSHDPVAAGREGQQRSPVEGNSNT